MTIVPIPAKYINCIYEFEDKIDENGKMTLVNTPAKIRIDMDEIDDYLEEAGIQDTTMLTRTRSNELALAFQNAADAVMFKLKML